MSDWINSRIVGDLKRNDAHVILLYNFESMEMRIILWHPWFLGENLMNDYFNESSSMLTEKIFQ